MNPAEIQQLLERALADHESGWLADAEKAYRAILVRSADHPDALHLLGVLRGDQGSLHEGIALVRRAIEGNPSAGAFYASLGGLLAAAGDTGGAIGAWRRALDLGGESPETHANLGTALTVSGDLEQAEHHWSRAAALAP